MNRLVLLIFVGCAMRANTVTFTSTIQTDIQPCGNQQDCQPFDFSIPQFSGAPSSITWAFSDSLNYYGGANDMGAEPGLMFTWSTTEGDQSPILGLDASNTQSMTEFTCGCRNLAGGGFWLETIISGSGSVGGSEFSGTGDVDVPVTPFLFASPGGGPVFAALIQVQDNATLTLTATYLPVPEPIGGLAFLTGAFLLLLRLKTKAQF